MLESQTAILWLVLFSAIFAIAGLAFARRHQDGLEDFIVARNSQTSQATLLTLLATTMGTWVLFGPAESATWGGIGAILGYALGALIPRLVMIPLGVRIRQLMPTGHTLTEFVYARYGRSVYVVVLSIMLFYLFISLTAGLTGIAQMVALLAPVPLWITASIVMLSTLLYTLYGGLKVTIFTDRIQMFVILPFILLILVLGWQATGGITPVIEGLQEKAPHLLNPFNSTGMETGVTFFLAVCLTGLFYQGTWQRIFAAKDNKAIRNGFIFSGLISFPIILALGLFGLAFVGLSVPGTGSTALFSVMLGNAPYWLLIGMIFFGLALIMSSADSTISGFHSLFIIDLNRILPKLEESKLVVASRWLIIVISILALIVASKGFSILYLFLLADLLCCAAAFPVFFGFYNARYQGYQALLSLIGGLVAGFFYFPMPGEPIAFLFESFLLATLIPVAISLALLVLPSKKMFDFTLISKKIKTLSN
ncbi:sodium:solute symporter [Marinomonas ushuaiensis DSM 15871]|uniref:Sodium:solute symporter n=1 Tax=Marinomonas ushuaiensis DSM 15871 TaxID=1122207 RepID=X7E556_9GAMM|nr:sodium:solute symporter [Marinomonas ushuaiensis]ETX10301.1 sodium:solute symporter [Marinomonas ushuaiensis DSM 15871]